MNKKAIIKRNETIDLKDYLYPGQYNPYTWEGCVVKMSDKIAYLARDIEDALRLNIIDEQLVEDLRNHLNQLTNSHFDAINNGTIVNYFILDVCQNSSIEKGICLSDEAFEVMKYIMKFNYQNIYLIDRIEVHTNYVQLILNSIFQFLYKYDKIANDKQINVLEALKKDQKKYPVTIQGYMHWLEKYSQMKYFNRNPLYQNHIIYDFEHDKNAMAKSIIDYLSGMSDAYILKIFNEFTSRKFSGALPFGQEIFTTAKKFASVSESKKLRRLTGRLSAAGFFRFFPSVSVRMTDHRSAAARYFVILTPYFWHCAFRSATCSVPFKTPIWSNGRNSPLT